MSHPYTRIVFRVGDDDAKKLAEGFSYFEAKDLRNLEAGQAVARVERSDYDFNLSVPLPAGQDKSAAAARRQEVTTVSREKYGTPRADVEAMLAKSRATPTNNEPPPTSPRSRPVEPKPPAAPTPAPVIAKPPPAIVQAPQVEMPPPFSEILKAAPAPVVEIHEPPREQSQGRGGLEHKALQKHIKAEAQKLGFISRIEESILEGQASVDVLLERNSLVIACEISFTNTEDNESSKIIKCLKGGFPKFVMICTDEKKLRKIAAAISGGLDSELAARVEYFQPDPFIEYLKTLPVEPPKKSEKIRRGYKVKHSQSSGSTEEQMAKEEAAIRAIAESMQQKKKQ